MSENNFVYKPQDVNYLGFLEAQLRDMTGLDTLAYELIQNADDVQDEDGRFTVTTLSFDITDEALIVSNNGQFRSVDFARLQSIAGGGKRADSGVTGAFGLGFLAVYQITDAPEIFSGGRHWIIRPDAPAEKRIEERQAATDQTRFRLPWAFDPTSRVRRTLRLEAIRPDQLDSFAQQMGEAVTRAALFLKQLERLEVSRNGSLIRRVERRRDGDRLQLVDERGQATDWWLLNGEFSSAAQQLRQQYEWEIEAGRGSSVQLAIPLNSELPAGTLYAGLPTTDTVPLACHLNAPFFPTTDRKHVHFADGYQAAWNQAAVQAAAAILPPKLAELRRSLSPTGLFKLLQSSFAAAQQAETGDLPGCFAAFWEALLPLLPQTALFYTAAGAWLPPADGRLLPRASTIATDATNTLLAALPLPVLHPDLAAYAPLLRQLGTPTLRVADIAAGLRRAGLAQPTALPAAPPAFRDLSVWQSLWTLLDVLLRDLPPAARAGALADLNDCAVVLADNLTLHPLTLVYQGRSEVKTLFPQVNWLHADAPSDSFPGRYLPSFGVRQAVELLAALPADALTEAWRLGRLDIPQLLRWFETQQIEIFADDPALARAIRQLPLCPVAGELWPLAELFLPGGFADPLQLTNIVDLDALGGREQFLRDLGVAELDFDTYLRVHLPRVLAARADLPSDGRHRLLDLLAARLGEIRDDAALQAELGQLPLIPCLDGSFRPAVSLFASRQVRALLGERAHIAETATSKAQQALYDWLGVRAEPAAADLVGALLASSQEWGTTPLPPAAHATVLNCWQALAESVSVPQAASETLAPLRGQPVIPDGQGRLTAPEALFLADRPDLAAQFPDFAPRLLPPDIAWLPAARAAGVRLLSEAVTIRVVAGDKASKNTALAALIRSRQPLLARLLRAETRGDQAGQTDILPDLAVMMLPNLRIQAQLQIGPRVAAAATQPVAAKWIDGVLYLDSEAQPVPWNAVARELAEALLPGRNVGGLALGIKEVLMAQTIRAAAAALDELGYA